MEHESPHEKGNRCRRLVRVDKGRLPNITKDGETERPHAGSVTEKQGESNEMENYQPHS